MAMANVMQSDAENVTFIIG
jgi:hypothetical protein